MNGEQIIEKPNMIAILQILFAIVTELRTNIANTVAEQGCACN